MDSMLIQYILFILGAFILIGGVITLNKRLTRQARPHEVLENWARLDAGNADSEENDTPAPADEEETEWHARARQNGHHAESQKPQV